MVYSPMTFPARSACFVFASLCALSARAIDTQPARSPFSATPAAAAPVASTDDSIQLIGVMTNTKDTLVGLADRASKRTLWIAVHSSSDGIRVDDYDAMHDVAKITVGGVQKTLVLRKSTVITGPIAAPPATGVNYNFAPAPANNVAAMPSPVAPMPATPTPVTTAPANPVPNPADAGKSPETIAKETEARMMVTDLLEIGMIQRKEYERKQKEAEDAKKAAAK